MGVRLDSTYIQLKYECHVILINSIITYKLIHILFWTDQKINPMLTRGSKRPPDQGASPKGAYQQ